MTQSTVREAVAVIEDVDVLEQAVQELQEAGFSLDQISLLADRQTVEKKLGHTYRRVEELEDEPGVPRTAYKSREGTARTEDRLVGALTYAPPLIAAGTVVASAGAVAAIIAGTAVAGALLGTAISHWIGQHHAEWLQEQLDRGGILLWVRTGDEERERSAVRILTHHAVHDVHIHELPTPE